MEEIVKKGDVPPLPEGVKIRMASRGALPGLEIQDLSEESIRSIVDKVRTGKYRSVMMAPDEENEEGFLELESSDELIFLQIWDAETETSWACFDPELLDSNEEAPITPSDGQSVFPMKCTMRDREDRKSVV